METNENKIWKNLFAGMSDEVLPLNFNEKVMRQIYKMNVLREKKRRFWEICGYASGFLAMLITCIAVLYKKNVSFELPEIAWTFPKVDFEIFTSPAFIHSFQVGVLALFLLIIDSTIRRRIEKMKHK